MSKYDCPYFDENRAVCDDGECGCWECQEVIEAEQNKLKKMGFEDFIKKLYDHIDYLEHENTVRDGDSDDNKTYKTGACVVIDDIKNFIYKETKL